MKKIFTNILIITIICAIISSILCYISLRYYGIGSEKSESVQTLQKLNNQLQNELENGGVSDVTGYGYLIAMPALSLVSTGEAIMQFIFVIVVPMFIEIILVLLQIVARLVQIGQDRKWKSTISKTVCIIAVILQIMLCVELLLAISIVNKAVLSMAVLTIVIIINIIGIIKIIRKLQKCKNNIVDNTTGPMESEI